MTSSPSDLVDAIERARPRLRRLATSVHHFPTIGSTNDEAIAIGVEGAVVVADAQTSGRGRRGHGWFSPPFGGVYASVVLAPGRARVDARRATSLVTLAVGVAVAEGVEAATGVRADLKWPNDLYVNRRKLAGILSESTGTEVVCGFGINVAPHAYPPDLRERVTSLEAELAHPVDRSAVLVEALAAIAVRYDDLLAGRFDAILDAWRARAPMAAGRTVQWATAGGLHSGLTDGVDADGALRVRTETGVERIVGGEVRWPEEPPS